MKKNSTAEWEECDSMEWLSNYRFYYSNLYSTGSYFSLLLFLLRRKRGLYTPVFAILFIQFSETVKAVRNESTWTLNLFENRKIGISSRFCNFCPCSRLFWTVQPSTYTRELLLSFLTCQSHVATSLILDHSHLFFWYVYIFNLFITFSVLLC